VTGIQSVAHSSSLAARFDPRSNSLNALRLVLASSVIVSHSWVLSGQFEQTLGVGDQLVGDIAVDGFFAVSGFLILGSRLASRSLLDFFWRRFLRIWPAFAVVLLFVAVIAAPVSVFVLGNGSFEAASIVTYVLKNLGLVIVQPGIDGTLVGLPEVGNWNAPLWTLAFEFGCYIAIAVLVTVLPRRLVGMGLWVGLVGALAVNLVDAFTSIDLLDPLVVFGRLGAFFVAGSLAYFYRDRLPISAPVGIAAGLISAVLILVQQFGVFGGPFFAVFLLWLGIVLPLRRVGARNDISYGMYIYAYPLQLLLAIIVGEALPAIAFTVISIVIAIPFAAASWFLVEKHAMRLKRLTATGRFSLAKPMTARRDDATQEPAI
jgi:peptidoglycan/LPS O-acetylase OafA/YrhL